MTKITVAKSAGFCFGVARAVDKAFELANSGVSAVTPVSYTHLIMSAIATISISSE